jgi:hypothetical protein
MHRFLILGLAIRLRNFYRSVERVIFDLRTSLIEYSGSPQNIDFQKIDFQNIEFYNIGYLKHRLKLVENIDC